jgi:hypothetical protein
MMLVQEGVGGGLDHCVALEAAGPQRRSWRPGPSGAAGLMLVLKGRAGWAVSGRALGFVRQSHASPPLLAAAKERVLQ